MLLGKVAKKYEKNWEGVELMKTQEQIQMEIDRLSKSNLDFNDKLKVTKGIGNREIIRHEVRKNERKIKILEWVLEG